MEGGELVGGFPKIPTAKADIVYCLFDIITVIGCFSSYLVDLWIIDLIDLFLKLMFFIKY